MKKAKYIDFFIFVVCTPAEKIDGNSNRLPESEKSNAESSDKKPTDGLLNVENNANTTGSSIGGILIKLTYSICKLIL